MKSMWMLSALAAAALVSGAADAAGPIVYPAKGQSAQQQQKDEGECYVWARNRTGIDPARPQDYASSAPQQDSSGNVAKGAVGGALGGAAIASIAGGQRRRF